MRITELFDDFEAIQTSIDACRVSGYHGSMLYLYPRTLKDKLEVHDFGSYRTAGDKGSSPLIIPVTLDSPKAYFAAVVDVIAKFGGVYNIPKAYATTLWNMGYGGMKRPWGHYDFVFETQHLIDLPGKRLKRDRTYLNALAREGLTFRDLTPDDYDQCEALYWKWREGYTHGNVGRQGYSLQVIKQLGQFPDHFRLNAIGAFIDGQLVGYTIGCVLSKDYWTSAYRYADNSYPKLNVALLQELAKRYQDIPFENDGDAGGVGSPLFEHKKRLLTPASEARSFENYVVTK